MLNKKTIIIVGDRLNGAAIKRLTKSVPEAEYIELNPDKMLDAEKQMAQKNRKLF